MWHLKRWRIIIAHDTKSKSLPWELQAQNEPTRKAPQLYIGSTLPQKHHAQSCWCRVLEAPQQLLPDEN